jgi:hypothetical protein
MATKGKLATVETEPGTDTGSNLNQTLYPHELVGILCDNATHPHTGGVSSPTVRF